MKPGRAFSLLTGVALLGGIAEFNEMAPDAQAAFLGTAADAARTATQSLVSNAVETYHGMMGKAAQPAAQPVLPQQRVAEVNEETASPRQPAPVRVADASTDAQSGNPLWALPLKQLTMTRDRPIFSPSRRPPPPPAPARAAPVQVRQVKPAEPEKPTVSLLGTIIGSGPDDRIGVFLETGTQNIVRLRVGEDHNGWVLRLIKAREVTLVKDGEQASVLELPAPGEAPPPGLGGAGIPGVLPGVTGLPTVTPPQRQRRQQAR